MRPSCRVAKNAATAGVRTASRLISAYCAARNGNRFTCTCSQVEYPSASATTGMAARAAGVRARSQSIAARAGSDTKGSMNDQYRGP